MKSFKPKDKQDTDGDNFRGQSRSNATHSSSTDPEAKLYKKGSGKEAKLSFSLNILTDNRHGLILDACLENADGYAEREAALKMLDRQYDEQGIAPRTLGADKAYHSQDFIDGLRKRRISPHVAERADRKLKGLDARTTRQPSYELSQKKRKLVEQPFGWAKAFAGFRKTRFIGKARTELFAQFTFAAFNLIRIAKLEATLRAA